MELTPILSLIVTIGGIIIATVVTIYRLGTFVEGLNKRFGNIDNKLVEHDKKFEILDKRFENVENKLNDIDKRVLSLEIEAKNTNFNINKVENRLERLENRIEKTEEKYILFLSAKVFGQDKVAQDKLIQEN